MRGKSKNNPLASSFDVISGLAQEIDAPLQSLVKSSQKLLNDYRSRDFEYISYKDFKNIIATLDQMHRQLQRCAVTTQRMISLSKGRGVLSLQSSSINETITEILHLLQQRLASAKIKVTTQLEGHLPAVAIGKVECHQVVHNVMINAIQAMPAGGKIRIRTLLSPERNMVGIDVEDEGVGITPEHLPKVFEPFFTTKERGVEKSVGLGLSIVYSLLHSVGGDIHIQSSLRKGTRVHIDLPVVPSVS